MDEPILDRILLDMGHSDFDIGTKYLRAAVAAYVALAGDVRVTKDVYPAVAVRFRSTPARVERNIRHSIGKAWKLCPVELRRQFFGAAWAESPAAPSNGCYIARLAAMAAREGDAHED